jgi:phage shock protein PspC (stress-responsive transcriptional regulator)
LRAGRGEKKIEVNDSPERLYIRDNRRQEMKKLHLSKDNKKIFGVCGGFGETYNLDPTLVRIIVVFLCLATGAAPLLVTYFIAWIIMPKESTG